MTSGLPYAIALVTAVSTVAIGLPRDLLEDLEPVPEPSASISPDVDVAPALKPMVAYADRVDGNKTLRLNRAPDGLFYATARVEGQNVRFVVDTGANVVVLSAKDARELGYAPRERITRGSLTTAGGATSAGWVTLRSVDVGGIELADVEAAVPHDGQGLSLMGQSLLRKLGTITLSGDVMTISCRKSVRGLCSG